MDFRRKDGFKDVSVIRRRRSSSDGLKSAEFNRNAVLCWRSCIARSTKKCPKIVSYWETWKWWEPHCSARIHFGNAKNMPLKSPAIYSSGNTVPLFLFLLEEEVGTISDLKCIWQTWSWSENTWPSNLTFKAPVWKTGSSWSQMY